MLSFSEAIGACPLIAILRGVKPDEVAAIASMLCDEGFAIIEVPLNSPDPLASIAALDRALRDRALIGAGTVLTPERAEAAANAGARLLLAPNYDPLVIAAARRLGIASMPGVATATEAFAALAAGADALKVFPASELGSGTVSAWKAVLPAAVPLFAVGGVDEAGFAPFLRVGVTGFGLGSSLYRPGDDAKAVAERGARAIAAWRDLVA